MNIPGKQIWFWGNVLLSTVDQVQTTLLPWNDSCIKVQKQLYNEGMYSLYKLSGKMREGTTVRENNREKQSDSKCYTLPSISSRTSLWPPMEIEGTSTQVYDSQTHLFGWPYPIHQPIKLPKWFPLKPLWLVGLVEWRNICLLYFHSSRV